MLFVFTGRLSIGRPPGLRLTEWSTRCSGKRSGVWNLSRPPTTFMHCIHRATFSPMHAVHVVWRSKRPQAPDRLPLHRALHSFTIAIDLATISFMIADPTTLSLSADASAYSFDFGSSGLRHLNFLMCSHPANIPTKNRTDPRSVISRWTEIHGPNSMKIEAGWENSNPELRFDPGQLFLQLFVLGNEVLVVFCNLLL